MKTLGVLCLNGRRQTVKISASTTILEVDFDSSRHISYHLDVGERDTCPQLVANMYV